MNAVIAIGAGARAALQASGGQAQPLAAFPDAPYFEAAGEIIWAGSRLPGRHPRAVLTAAPLVRAASISFGPLPREAWSRALPRGPRVVRGEVAAACRDLIAGCDALGEPRGFGAMLFGIAPGFPLDLAAARVHALARAYAADDTGAVCDATRELLGLGTGLTPSGDDLCGAALFGRRLVSRDAHWRQISERLARDARIASHAISAALFADLAAGESFESLHALADALVAQDAPAALAATRELTALGHSSGWDMLTGFTIGTGAWPTC